MYFIQKFGSLERSKQLQEHVKHKGTTAGIDFRFEAMPRVVNTMPLHRILHFAAQEGIQNELEERFF